MRAILIILDSVGIGAAPDADEFHDAGASTLAHLARAAGALHLPILQSLGLGNIPALIPGGELIAGVPPAPRPLAGFGAMQPVSKGKDTTTGHWEIAGLDLQSGFYVFPKGPPSFPPELVRELEARTGRRLIGNKAASGTAIIDELGPVQIQHGVWIVYTSADSVLQIAAHEDVIPLKELYRACEIARELCDRYPIGRVIARPYLGRPGAFRRTENRRDFSYPPPEATLLDRLTESGTAVHAVGKIEDIFARRGITRAYHTGNNRDSQAKVIELMRGKVQGLIIANFIDFDMLYGHRRDAGGYARALEDTDGFLKLLLPLLQHNDLLILTADHGNDPTFMGTDHTREYVPLLAYQTGRPGRSLGIRRGFFDIAQTLATFFRIQPMLRGTAW
ncbi:MAG: phosphopentomutase [Verrucomicrobia bacterium]|nr:phosphopentomutase [Verrucomicrobiota bacterium]MBU4246771.1 phosphopentomutase [Verrucomicrobiota bacterium]MBU4290559.1 phosphopentomutase [Verrucomicrobiota bacterium]MBU4496619.1 phosphopentomutase [Verrucomicrobiota bacterium]MCG2681680.1 phosphopentomutase [Kiritimatiellia bacterium]